MSIVVILQEKLNDPKYGLILAPNEIKYVQALLNKMPEKFNAIHKTIDDILEDGQVNIHDIPKMVLLISQIYKQNVIPQLVKTIDMFKIVRFTLDALFDSGILPISSFETQVIQRVVDSSLDLLALELPKVEEEVVSCCHMCCWWSCRPKKPATEPIPQKSTHPVKL
jgi:hypothetical protein